MFQKNVKKIVDVEHDYFYRCANFQPEMFCIPPYTKKTNLEKFELCTIHTSDPEICHFYIGQNKKYFELKIYTAVEIVMFYIHDFFHIFLKHKMRFSNF